MVERSATLATIILNRPDKLNALNAAMWTRVGEVFVDLGLAIKRGSPFRTTLVIELSNQVETIYIPTRAAYASGSYEVTNSNVQPGSGEMLVESAIRQLRLSAQEVVK